MNGQLYLSELVIVIAAKGLKPNAISAEFLKHSSIVPQDWKLAAKPIRNQKITQVKYQNGVIISAEFNRIILRENIANKQPSEIAISNMARKYIEIMPNLEYRAIAINPQGYLTFDGSSEAVRNYFSQGLFAPASWQEFGTAPVNATVDLYYTLESGKLRLQIAPAQLKRTKPEPSEESIVVFSGNFEHPLTKETQQERLLQLQQYLAGWQTDLDSYKELIESKFVDVRKAVTVG